MPWLRAACAASAPNALALAALAANFSPSRVALLVVEAAAKVRPAVSSTNWTWMFWLVKQTLMRGRSLVPRTFRRIRQWRRRANSCFCSVLIRVFRHASRITFHGLLHRLAFFAHDPLIGVAHALAFVGLGRVKAADFR